MNVLRPYPVIACPKCGRLAGCSVSCEGYRSVPLVWYLYEHNRGIMPYRRYENLDHLIYVSQVLT